MAKRDRNDWKVRCVPLGDFDAFAEKLEQALREFQASGHVPDVYMMAQGAVLVGAPQPKQAVPLLLELQRDQPSAPEPDDPNIFFSKELHTQTQCLLRAIVEILADMPSNTSWEFKEKTTRRLVEIYSQQIPALVLEAMAEDCEKVLQHHRRFSAQCVDCDLSRMIGEAKRLLKEKAGMSLS